MTILSKLREELEMRMKKYRCSSQYRIMWVLKEVRDLLDSLEKETDIDQDQVKENIRVMDEQDERPLVQLPEVEPSSIISKKSSEIKKAYKGLSWEESDIKAIKQYLDDVFSVLQKHPAFIKLFNNK